MQIKHGFRGERFLLIPFEHVSSMLKDPLTGDIFIHSLGYFSNAANHYIDRPNGKEEHILIYCKSGAGWVCIDGERYDVKENEFIILKPGIPHSYGADKNHPWTIYWVHFLGKKAPLFAKGFDKPTLAVPDGFSRTEDRINLFEEMYTVLNNGFSSDHLNYANLCLAHFLGTFIFIKPFRKVAKNAVYSANSVTMVIYHMHENIGSKLTIHELASYLGYSESYFYHIFLRETGYSPIDYFNRLKIDKACEYLSHSDMKIVQIAHMLGFTDPHYFSRMFSGIKGMSPLSYRKEKLFQANL